MDEHEIQYKSRFKFIHHILFSIRLLAGVAVIHWIFSSSSMFHRDVCIYCTFAHVWLLRW